MHWCCWLGGRKGIRPVKTEQWGAGISLTWVVPEKGHQLGYMQVCTSLQTIIMPAPHHSVFYRPGALPAAQQTASKHWRQLWSKMCIEIYASLKFRLSTLMIGCSTVLYLQPVAAEYRMAWHQIHSDLSRGHHGPAVVQWRSLIWQKHRQGNLLLRLLLLMPWSRWVLLFCRGVFISVGPICLFAGAFVSRVVQKTVGGFCEIWKIGRLQTTEERVY